jgi:hypothetical protein
LSYTYAMRFLSLAIVLLATACGTSDPAPVQAAVDAGEDVVVDAVSDGAPLDKCATVKCGAPKVCDKVDGVCKNVRFSKLGEACGGDAGACTGPVGATCLGEFPDGYCSIMPCSVDNPCPIGAVCAKLGGKQACFESCTIDGDCRGGVDYKCQDINDLVISGGLRRVCYLPAIPCTTNADCPKPLLCNDGKSCTTI